MLELIKRYKDEYNKINDKILRPIFFKDAYALYLFLCNFILGRDLTITQYSNDDEGEGLIIGVLGWDIDVVDIKLENNPCFCIPAGNILAKYYTNNDRSIFVYIPQGSDYNGRYTFIIK